VCRAAEKDVLRQTVKYAAATRKIKAATTDFATKGKIRVE